MDVTRFEAMLKSGQDNALLRFTMGSAFYKLGKFDEAETHLQKALEYNPEHSATWKIYGRVLTALGKTDDAIATFKRGIAVATAQGDVQTAKEMNVFLKRLGGTIG